MKETCLHAVLLYVRHPLYFRRGRRSHESSVYTQSLSLLGTGAALGTNRDIIVQGEGRVGHIAS